jgi:hypothetical protein
MAKNNNLCLWIFLLILIGLSIWWLLKPRVFVVVKHVNSDSGELGSSENDESESCMDQCMDAGHSREWCGWRCHPVPLPTPSRP